MTFSSGKIERYYGNILNGMDLPPKWIAPKSIEEINQEKTPNEFEGSSGIIFP